MHLFLKRLLILVMVVAFGGMPLRPSLLQAAGMDCPASSHNSSKKIQADATHRAVSDESVSYHADPSIDEASGCVAKCGLSASAVLPAIAINFHDWQHREYTPVMLTMRGQTPEPELLPPIATF